MLSIESANSLNARNIYIHMKIVKQMYQNMTFTHCSMKQIAMQRALGPFYLQVLRGHVKEYSYSASSQSLINEVSKNFS